jgi:hypothetical protein
MTLVSTTSPTRTPCLGSSRRRSSSPKILPKAYAHQVCVDQSSCIGIAPDGQKCEGRLPRENVGVQPVLFESFDIST